MARDQKSSPVRPKNYPSPYDTTLKVGLNPRKVSPTVQKAKITPLKPYHPDQHHRPMIEIKEQARRQSNTDMGKYPNIERKMRQHGTQ